MLKVEVRQASEKLRPGDGPRRPHALVTGGSSGIGLAVARRLSADGMNVSLVARDARRLEAARSALACSSGGGEVGAFSADVAVAGEAGAAVAAAVRRFGPPALVVTAAGMVMPGHFTDLPAEAFERTMAVNFHGTVHVVRAALPSMLGRGGRIVMIASGAALIGIYGYTAYAASKFALRGFAEALRAELSHERIGVSIAFPPDTDTPQLAEEQRQRPPETRMMAGTAGVWTADAVAECILRGARRGRFAITPGFALGCLYTMGGLLSPLVQRYWAWRVQALHRRGLPPESEERKA